MWTKLIKRRPRGDPQNIERIIQMAKAKALMELKDELFLYEGEPKPEEN